MKEILFRSLPHVIAMVVFMVVSSAFFSPAFNGYALRQGDIAQFKGMSKEIVDYRALYGEEPLWTGSMFGGMPAYQVSMLQSRNVPLLIQTAVRKAFPSPVGTLFLAMLSFYVLGLCLRVNPWLAGGAALAFGLSSIHILYLGAGHMSKVNAIALMPGVLGGVLLTFRGRLLYGAAVTLLFLAMHLAANHLQMTYYLLYLVGFTVIGEVVRLSLSGEVIRAARGAILLVLVALFAVLPNMTNILTTYDYSKFTTRGDSELTINPPGKGDQEIVSHRKGLDKSYMLEYSMARGEFWSLLVPNIKGGKTGLIGNDRDLLEGVNGNYIENVAQSNRYWGDQLFTGGAFYLGALIMALFLIALFALSDGLRWPFLVLSILAIVLSWKHTNFIGDFFIDYVPLYAKFRDTKMMLVVISVMAPTLAMLLVDRLIKQEGVARKMLLVGSGVTAGIVFAFVASPGLFFDFTSTEEQAMFGEYLAESDGSTQRYIKGFVAELESVRQGILRADALRSLLFVLLGIALLQAIDRKWLKPGWVMAVFALVVLLDQYPVNRRYLNNDVSGREYVHWQPNIEKHYPQPAGAADAYIYNREIAERSALLKDINQFVTEQQDAARSMLELVNRNEREEFTNRIKMAAQTAVLRMHTNYRSLFIRNTFNDVRTSYYHRSIGGYHGAKLGRYQEMIDFHINPEIERFVESAQTSGLGVMANLPFLNMLNTRYIIVDPNSEPIENPFANGSAWFVEEVVTVPTADDVMEALYDFDSKRTAVVHERYQSQTPEGLSFDSTAQITITGFLPNHLTYEAVCSREQFAVFSEIHYPSGWQCYLNGEAVDHVCVNYILRGVTIPPGEHTIDFIFEPRSYQNGQSLATVGSILFILSMLGTLWVAWRSRKTLED
jgi:hypothetical protein